MLHIKICTLYSVNISIIQYKVKYYNTMTFILNCQISSCTKHIQKAIVVNLLNESAVNKIWQCSVFKNYW